MTRIGILGSGNVGRALAGGFVESGHDVVVASRDPARAELVAWGGGAGAGIAGFAETAEHAEVAVLATPWGGTEQAIGLTGNRLAGKVLIDATNPLVYTDRLELAMGHTDSGGEQVQRWAPDARVVKAFNTVGFELMNRPALTDGPGTLFIAGDDPEAKDDATSLARELGWTTHDCGGIEKSRLTEPLALIWIDHAGRTGCRTHSLRLIGTD